MPPQIYYVDRYIAAKNERPVIDARAKQCYCQKSTHQADRFYYAVIIPCYHDKVNAHMNIHAACECCHVTVVKHKARQNARYARQTGKAHGKIPVNGRRRPYKRTQGARWYKHKGKGESPSESLLKGFIAVLILSRPSLALYVTPRNKDVFNAIDAKITRGRCLAAVGHDDRFIAILSP